MAKPELGTKRACPETGKNFYDLNKDPIVSPYTGKEYPLTFFMADEEQKKSKEEAAKTADAKEETAEAEDEEGVVDGPEIISLEDAEDTDDDVVDGDMDDDDDVAAMADIPSVDLDDDDDDIGEDDDTFLEEDEEETDFSDVIGSRDDGNKDEV